MTAESGGKLGIPEVKSLMFHTQ